MMDQSKAKMAPKLSKPVDIHLKGLYSKTIHTPKSVTGKISPVFLLNKILTL